MKRSKLQRYWRSNVPLIFSKRATWLQLLGSKEDNDVIMAFLWKVLQEIGWWLWVTSLVRFWSCRNGKSWQITEKQYIGRNTRNSFHGLIFGHCWLAHRLCDWTATDWWDTDLIQIFIILIISHHSGMVPFRSGSLSFYARHDCPCLEANHGQSNDAFVIGQVVMVVFQTKMSSFFLEIARCSSDLEVA